MRIELTGEVGGQTFNFGQVRDLPPVPLRILIDSPGGDGLVGDSIFQVLSNHPALVTTEIFRACSAAVLPALSGTHRLIRGDGHFFLHCGWGVIIGTASAYQAAADLMSKRDRIHAHMVAQRTGQDPATIHELMKNESRLNAQQCLNLGLVTAIIGLPDNTPSPPPNLLKTALAAVDAQRRMMEPDRAMLRTEASPTAMLIPGMTEALESPESKPPNIPTSQAGIALDALYEAELREAAIRQSTRSRVSQIVTCGGKIEWPLSTIWRCGSCHTLNHHPPIARRFASPCHTCGLPLSPTLEEPPT